MHLNLNFYHLFLACIANIYMSLLTNYLKIYTAGLDLILAVLKNYEMLKLQLYLEHAPYDAEPLTDEDMEAIKQAKLEYEQGEYISLDVLKKKLGL